MRKNTIAAVFAVLLPALNVAGAQQRKNVHVRGIVRSSESHGVISGATVGVVGGRARQSEVTDAKGFFDLVLIDGTMPGESVRIRVEKSGYKAYDENVAVSENVVLQFEISPLKSRAPARKDSSKKTTTPSAKNSRTSSAGEERPSAVAPITESAVQAKAEKTEDLVLIRESRELAQAIEDLQYSYLEMVRAQDARIPHELPAKQKEEWRQSSVKYANFRTLRDYEDRFRDPAIKKRAELLAKLPLGSDSNQAAMMFNGPINVGGLFIPARDLRELAARLESRVNAVQGASEADLQIEQTGTLRMGPDASEGYRIDIDVKVQRPTRLKGMEFTFTAPIAAGASNLLFVREIVDCQITTRSSSPNIAIVTVPTRSSAPAGRISISLYSNRKAVLTNFSFY